MSVINNNLLLTPEGYQISRSVRLRSSASAYFNRTPASAGNRKTWTWSGWVKRGAIDQFPFIHSNFAANNNSYLRLGFGGSTISLWLSSDAVFITSAVYRDPSAWYHVVFAVDTTQATAANRYKLYVNGVEVTSFYYDNRTIVAQNTDLAINSTNLTTIGYAAFAGYADGYLTEVNFIDGQALTPSSFGETDAITGVWKPKKYAGTYGTNGFYLNFSDNSAATAAAIGKDSSGNGNNWTPNNVSVTAGATYDSMIDTPTPYSDGGNGRGNYAVLNPLRTTNPSALSEANLKYSNGANEAGSKAISTIGVSSGKWYFEGQWVSGPSNSRFCIGLASSTTALTSVSLPIEKDGSNLSMTTSDTAQVAIDFDAGKVWFGKNNTWLTSGDPASGANPTATFTAGTYDFLFPAIRLYSAGDATTVGVANFGQRPFAYTPPTGFKALNTQNLPDATITKGNKHFDVSLYTGTNSAQSIVNSGAFQPDFVWVKGRNVAASHNLLDSVRGPRIHLSSNLTNAEETESAGVGLTAFNSNGFALGTDNAGSGQVNANGNTYSAWQWKAGGTAVSNTAGSITSQVSANTTAGFSVVTFTAPASGNFTAGHGLGVAPKMVVIKSRDNAVAPWYVYHSSLAADNYLRLNATNATALSSGVWGAGMTSSVIGSQVGNSTVANSATVAYCFSEVAGFSKFGSYTGNGSADGPFVYCGFRPRFVMYKRTDTTGNWVVLDTARDTTNANDIYLYPNDSVAESSGAFDTDFLSNGFKLRNTNTTYNASGGTYIFAAFAENPFKNSLAR